MAEEKEIILIDLRIDKGETEKTLDSVTKKVIELQEENKQLLQANKELEKQGLKNTQAFVDNSKAVEINKGKISESVAVQKSLIQSLAVENNSINALVAKNRELTKERNNLNLSTKEGTDRLNQINSELDKNNKLIKDNVSGLEKQKIGIGGYKEAIAGALADAGPFGQAITSQVDTFSKMLNPLTAATAALGGLAGMYVSSAAGARDLESAQTQLSTSFTTLSNDIAELAGADGKGGGLLSGLAFQFNLQFFGANAAIQGQIAAGAQQNLKDLEVTEMTVKRVAKNALDQAEELRRIRDDDTKTQAERQKAAQQVEGFINVRETVLVNLQQQRLNNLKILLSLDKDNLDIQKAVKAVEFEISDIQEDSQGKRTEALNGINTLQKEQNTLKEEDKKLTEQASKYADDLEKKLINSKIEAAQIEKDLQDQRLKNFRQFYDAENNVVGNATDAQIKIQEKGLQYVKQINDQFNKEKAEGDKQVTGIQTDNQKKIIQSLYNTSTAVRGTASQNTGVYKAAATFQIGVDTRAAAIAAYKSVVGIPLIGPVLAVIAAAAAVAFGLKQLEAVNNVKTFARGGQVNNGVRWGTVGGKSHAQGGTKYYGEDGHVVEFERGEGWYVARPNVHTGFLARMSQMNEADGGRSWNTTSSTRKFADGGFVYTPTPRGLSSSDVTDIVKTTIRNMPPIVVTVEDINKGQTRVAEVNNASRLF